MDGTNDFDNVSKNSENPQKRNNYGSVLPDAKDFTWSSPNKRVQGKNFTDTLTISEILDESWLKRRIWINVSLLYAAIFFVTMGIAPLAILQSSMNSENGLGVASLAVKNGFMVVGSIVAPSMIKRFGCKSAVVIGAVLYITYVPANFYPSWFTLIPFAMIGGFGCTVNLVAYKVYIARLAHLYADVIAMDVDRMNSRLFVLMVCAIKSSAALGNFVASFILNAGAKTEATDDDDRSRLDVCGINYCNQEFSFRNDSSVQPQVDVSARIYFLIGVCTASSILSVLLFALMDPLKKFGISSMPDKGPTSPFSVLKDLLTAMKDPRHVLFIPMTIALSGGDAFWNADFTKAFVTCSIGMSYLGYVSVWNGLSGTASCIILGWFNSKKTRSLPVISATLMQMVILTGLFYWIPSTILMVNYWTLSIFGIIFFFGSGIRHFIAPVLISVVFKDNLETAFSVFHFWCYVSSTLFYGWSNFLCMSFKIYFLLVILALSFMGYIFMEVIVNRNPASNEVKYKKLVDDETS